MPQSKIHFRKLSSGLFMRRMLMLLIVAFGVLAVLGVQFIRLAVVEAETHLREAESVLSTHRYIDTTRGGILDRYGRVLAEDQPCWDISVHYTVLTGQWAYQQARHAARKANRQRWGELTFDQRDQLTLEHIAKYEKQIRELNEALIRLGQMTHEQLAERKREIIAKVDMIRTHAWSRRAKRRAEQLQRPVTLEEVMFPIAEERDHHRIIAAASEPVARYFRKYQDDMPGVKVERSNTRIYPRNARTVQLTRDTLPTPIRSDETITLEVQGHLTHLLGWMRRVYAEDVEAWPFRDDDGQVDRQGYLPGDTVGSLGIESGMEPYLRGTRGKEMTDLETQRVTRIDPVPGRDVQLTIDADLQAIINGILDPRFGLTRVQSWHRNNSVAEGESLASAVVVLDVANNEILAMNTWPSFTYEQMQRDPQSVFNDPMGRATYRPTTAIYPPGSTLKPIVYCIATAQRKIATHQHFNCEGHLLPDRTNIYRCWGWRPNEGKYLRHGELGPAEAIARSCNIYFYNCGRILGAWNLVTGLQDWGFGQTVLDILPEESPGMLPNLNGPNVPGRELNRSNAIMMGIGQGPIAATLLQVANAHAAMARGGHYRKPQLIRSPVEAITHESRDLHLSSDANAQLHAGLFASANESYGTAHHLTLSTGREPTLTVEGITVEAKTGTAQAPDLRFDADDDGVIEPDEPVVRSGVHGWYVCHVRPQGQRHTTHIVVVMVEYGGSGGRVAGPIANQVLHAMKDLGYLNAQ